MTQKNRKNRAKNRRKRAKYEPSRAKSDRPDGAKNAEATKNTEAAENRLVTAYIAELERELKDAPEHESRQLIEKVRAEFQGRLAGIDDPTDRQVLPIINALGPPRALAIGEGLISPPPEMGPGQSGWLLSRGAVGFALAGLILTLFSSLAAVIAASIGLVLTALCVPRWQSLQKTLVLAVIILAITAITLFVQVFGATQGS